MVAHLRSEKDPLRAAAALARLPDEPIEVVQIGDALDERFALEVSDLAKREPRFRWYGGVTHARALAWMAKSHVLVVSSRMEGGATPPLALEDMQGKSHDLAEYRGKVVLVNFWATWCVPCREEMPSIDRLRSSMKGQPFEVLAVNMAEPLSRIEKFLSQMPLGFPLLRDRDGAASRAWKAKLLPASFLIGRDGRIRYVAYGELDWSSDAVRARVAELLK